MRDKICTIWATAVFILLACCSGVALVVCGPIYGRNGVAELGKWNFFHLFFWPSLLLVVGVVGTVLSCRALYGLNESCWDDCCDSSQNNSRLSGGRSRPSHNGGFFDFGFSHDTGGSYDSGGGGGGGGCDSGGGGGDCGGGGGDCGGGGGGCD
uniref:Uncharacterized protein n=1 Tax=Branchiostoma floridae TaxID=7739 RepID=C3ZGW1_BRAFL|eukprot:XP_002592097.1 hypothetical protein BRAFLDRAFT_84966 [Branchiostoma floridae]